ncbi:MAG: peptidyl-prolyl cis-trans isomerase [Proteobacteria bacterium]|nr:peptidyl-prolyl cis-trans isomerase [Pseudomonadota bacterium]
MLDFLRRSASSWVIKILFGLLILSFGIWGIGDIFRGPGSADVVANVGDAKITVRDLGEAYRRDISQFERVFGDQLQKSEVLRRSILEQTLSRLISSYALEETARDLGLRVSKEILARTVHENPAFQDPQGRFERTRLENALFSSGLTEERYLRLLHDDLVRSQLADSIGAGARAPKALLDAFYRFRNERRSAETIVFKPALIAGGPDPTEAELKAFHEERANQFSSPEYRALSVARLSAKALAREMEVSEARLKEAYQTRIDEFRLPERREVVQVFSASEEGARKAYERTQAGEPIEKAAAEVKGAEMIRLGLMRKEDFPVPELAHAAFALGAGQVSQPLPSPLGWHLLKVERIEPPRDVPFAEAKDRLRASLAEETALDRAFDMVNQLEDRLAGGSSLEDTAKALALDLVTVAAVDAEGRDRQGKPVDPIAGSEEALRAAFELAAGQQSGVIEAGDGEFLVLRVDAVTPAALRPLAEVRDKVAAAWREERRRQEAQKLAEAALEKAKGGEGLAAIAAAHKLSVERIASVTRLGRSGAEVAPALVGALFQIKPGEAALAETPEGFVLARLTEVQPANPAADAQAAARMQANLSLGLANDLQVQYLNALRRDLGVSVNRQALDALLR